MKTSNGMKRNNGAVSININKISCLALILALLGLGVISTFMMMDMKKQELGNHGSKKNPAASSGASSRTLAQQKALLSQFKPVEVSKIKKVRQLKDYAAITERNPFAPYEGASKGKGEGKGESVSGRQKKSSILSETPEFLYRGSVTAGGVLKCALEDVETKEIYFLKKGENIKEYFVLDIQRDKVILSQKKGGEMIVPLFE